MRVRICYALPVGDLGRPRALFEPDGLAHPQGVEQILLQSKMDSVQGLGERSLQVSLCLSTYFGISESTLGKNAWPDDCIDVPLALRLETGSLVFIRVVVKIMVPFWVLGIPAFSQSSRSFKTPGGSFQKQADHNMTPKRYNPYYTDPKP